MEFNSWPARFLLIGEAPSRKHGKRNLEVCLACRSVSRHPGAGTMGWLRVNHRYLFEFVIKTKHINLIDQWPGKQGNGSAFPVEKAKIEAENLKKFAVGYDAVLLAGKRVAKAFELDLDYFEWKQVNGRPYAVVPHPSGINRWWNDTCNRDTAKTFLEQLIWTKAP